MSDFEFRGRRVLVTGGAGFIGGNMVERLVGCGANVVVLDDLSTGRLENIDRDFEFEFVKGSVVDRELVNKLVKGADFVVHLAARNIVLSTKNPLSDYEANIGGTLNMLLASRDHGIERMVYSSSASVYGNPRILPIAEDERPHTFSPYAVSKLAGENYCRAFYETYDVPVAALRYSNVYGPKQSPTNPYCGVVAKFVEALELGRAPQLHGDGQQTRDFTYAGDAVDATLTALLSPKSEGLVFNLGTGIETSVADLCEMIAELMGVDVEPEHIDRRDIDNIRRRVLNIELIRTRLRWQPQLGLREGLRRTIEWHRSK